jgi:hypothetical protein
MQCVHVLLMAVTCQPLHVSPQCLAASLDQAVRPEDVYFNTLVRILTTRCMTPAQYFGSGEHGKTRCVLCCLKG